MGNDTYWLDWRDEVTNAYLAGAEFGYNKAKVEVEESYIEEQLEEAKTIIQDLLSNSDEYARQRAMDFLKETE